MHLIFIIFANLVYVNKKKKNDAHHAYNILYIFRNSYSILIISMLFFVIFDPYNFYNYLVYSLN